MPVLSFTTSTDHGGVAVAKEKRILGSVAWTRGPNQSESLNIKITGLLKKLKLKPEDIKGIAVDKGPGSFTGCRISVNVAKTMAYTLGIPIIPVFSLDALAHGKKKGGKTHRRFLCVLDAHKALLYCRWYENSERGIIPSSPIAARPIEDLLSAMQITPPPSSSSASTLVLGLCPKSFADEFKKTGATVIETFPDAKIIAQMGIAALVEKSPAIQTWKEVEPSYIRSPDVVEKLQQR